MGVKQRMSIKRKRPVKRVIRINKLTKVSGSKDPAKDIWVHRKVCFTCRKELEKRKDYYTFLLSNNRVTRNLDFCSVQCNDLFFLGIGGNIFDIVPDDLPNYQYEWTTSNVWLAEPCRKK